jgi:hypothetical protein
MGDPEERRRKSRGSQPLPSMRVAVDEAGQWFAIPPGADKPKEAQSVPAVVVAAESIRER